MYLLDYNWNLMQPEMLEDFLQSCAWLLSLTPEQRRALEREIARDCAPRLEYKISLKPKKVPKPTFLYLMKNRRNGYTKIGISKNPTTREWTLQSQEPEIEMIFSAPSTHLAELQLHSKFSDKRVRGEWFDLSDEDIRLIQELASSAISAVA